MSLFLSLLAVVAAITTLALRLGAAASVKSEPSPVRVESRRRGREAAGGDAA